jgi:hypothetical protein
MVSSPFKREFIGAVRAGREKTSFRITLLFD